MKMIPLGRTDIQVSDWCLGTMTYSTHTPQADAHKQIDMALDAGINFADTAEMYPVSPILAETVGDSEKVIGTWIAKSGRRDDLVIATKVSGDNPGWVRGGAGYDAQVIDEAIDTSLKRLQTDYIDLYQMHWPLRGSYMFRQNWAFDPSGQNRQQTLDHMAEILEALDRAQKAGKIRAIGMSNESAWGMTKWIDVAEANGYPRMASVQNEYSLLCRLYDLDSAEMAVNEDVTLLSFSPLAAGILTGKYRNGAVPAGSRKADNPDMSGRATARCDAAVEAYAAIAAKHGLDLAHMALAWQRSRPFAVSAIFGATTSDQLAHLLKGRDLVLGDEVLADIHDAHQAHPLPY